MKSFKLTIAYDGTAYAGWQEQPGRSTLEGLIKQRLQDVFKVPIDFTGASRTDAGVHALGQVARIKTDLPITACELERICAQVMPPDIQVRSVRVVPASFHPRHEVAHKVYYYNFFTQPPGPFFGRYGHYMPKLRYPLFKRLLAEYCGTHDFVAFCTDPDERSTVKTIDALSCHYYERWGLYQVRITGHSFLRHMIRRMVGAGFSIASHDVSEKAALERLHTALAGTYDHQLIVAPPHGLVLAQVVYATDQPQVAENQNGTQSPLDSLHTEAVW